MDSSSCHASDSSCPQPRQSDHAAPEMTQPTKLNRRQPALRCAGFLLVNFWLIFHLLGIVLPPASVEPSPSSVRSTFWALRFYPQLLYMDHGYHFFSPDPGDSTLVRFVANSDTVDRAVRGRYPHKRIWPRLLYHRYFMLTESVPRFAELEPKLYELLSRCYAKRIAENHLCSSVELYRVTHHMTDANVFRAGRGLNDPETFDETRIGDFAWPGSFAASVGR